MRGEISTADGMSVSAECWCSRWQLLLKIQRGIVPTEAAKQRVKWLIKYIQCWTIKCFSFPSALSPQVQMKQALNKPLFSSQLSRRSYAGCCRCFAQTDRHSHPETRKSWRLFVLFSLMIDTRSAKLQLKFLVSTRLCADTVRFISLFRHFCHEKYQPE